MAKDSAIQRIDSHEKLCRIMQKQTHDKILKLERQINRVESILLVSVGTLVAGMASLIVMLITKIWARYAYVLQFPISNLLILRPLFLKQY